MILQKSRIHPQKDILGCCGVESFNDWSSHYQEETTSNGTTVSSQYDLPSSCCVQLSPPDEFLENPSELFCHSELPTIAENKTSEMEFLRVYDSGIGLSRIRKAQLLQIGKHLF